VEVVVKENTLTIGFISLLIALSLACNLSLLNFDSETEGDRVGTSVAQTISARESQATPLTNLPLATPPLIATTAIFATITITPSHTASLTPTPTLLPGKVYSYGLLRTGEFMVVIQFNEPISGEFTAIVDGKDFECEILPKYPNRLYCTGPNLPAGKVVDININNTAEPGKPAVPIYYASFRVPIIPTDTPRPVRPRRTRTPPVIITYY
jgi:hypothetical protein